MPVPGWLGAILVTAAAAAAATEQRVDSDAGRYATVPDPRILVGHYRLEEGEFSIDVRLNADRTASYVVTMDKRGGGLRADGVWDYRGDRVHIHNSPGPVSLVQEGDSTTAPAVALSIVAMLPDGSPAEGLAVTWPGADALFYMSDGRHRRMREEGAVSGEVTIVRESDSKELATFVVTPGGPNSFHFTYRPSDPEPFDIEAAAMDPLANVLEVEAGSAAAPLRRVKD